MDTGLPLVPPMTWWREQWGYSFLLDCRHTQHWTVGFNLQNGNMSKTALKYAHITLDCWVYFTAWKCIKNSTEIGKHKTSVWFIFHHGNLSRTALKQVHIRLDCLVNLQHGIMSRTALKHVHKNSIEIGIHDWIVWFILQHGNVSRTALKQAHIRPDCLIYFTVLFGLFYSMELCQEQHSWYCSLGSNSQW